MFNRSRRIKLIIAVVLGIVLVLGLGIWGSSSYYSKKIDNQKEEYERIISTKNAELSRYELSSVKGYTLKNDKEAGDKVLEQDILLVDMPDFFSPENVITDKNDLVGKILKINLGRNTVITSEMVYEDGPLDPTARKIEIDFVNLPIKLKEKDVIDIVIVFPNAERYLVVSKKKMDSFDLNSQMLFIQASLEEQHLLDSALYDAYINNAELQAIRYVEPEMQPRPIPNYYPNQDVLRQIKVSPNILDKARYEISEQMRRHLDERLDAIPDKDKVRMGANLPEGSAVSKKRQTVGASIIVTQDNNGVNNVQEDTHPDFDYVEEEYNYDDYEYEYEYNSNDGYDYDHEDIESDETNAGIGAD